MKTYFIENSWSISNLGDFKINFFKRPDVLCPLNRKRRACLTPLVAESVHISTLCGNEASIRGLCEMALDARVSIRGPATISSSLVSIWATLQNEEHRHWRNACGKGLAKKKKQKKQKIYSLNRIWTQPRYFALLWFIPFHSVSNRLSKAIFTTINSINGNQRSFQAALFSRQPASDTNGECSPTTKWDHISS